LHDRVQRSRGREHPERATTSAPVGTHIAVYSDELSETTPIKYDAKPSHQVHRKDHEGLRRDARSGGARSSTETAIGA